MFCVPPDIFPHSLLWLCISAPSCLIGATTPIFPTAQHHRRHKPCWWWWRRSSTSNRRRCGRRTSEQTFCSASNRCHRRREASEQTPTLSSRSFGANPIVFVVEELFIWSDLEPPLPYVVMELRATITIIVSSFKYRLIKIVSYDWVFISIPHDIIYLYVLCLFSFSF